MIYINGMGRFREVSIHSFVRATDYLGQPYKCTADKKTIDVVWRLINMLNMHVYVPDMQCISISYVTLINCRYTALCDNGCFGVEMTKTVITGRQ